MSNKIEYDEYGRIIFMFEPTTQTTYYYSYWGDKRTIKIFNENNVSNFRTAKIQHMLNGEWTDTRSEEYGETYYTLKKFEEGKEVYKKQINLISNSVYIKHTRYGKDNIPIWIEQYKDKKSIGFKIHQKHLSEWTIN